MTKEDVYKEMLELMRSDDSSKIINYVKAKPARIVTYVEIASANIQVEMLRLHQLLAASARVISIHVEETGGDTTDTLKA